MSPSTNNSPKAASVGGLTLPPPQKSRRPETTPVDQTQPTTGIAEAAPASQPASSTANGLEVRAETAPDRPTAPPTSFPNASTFQPMPSASQQAPLAATPLVIPAPPAPTHHAARIESAVVGLRVPKDTQKWWRRASTVAAATYELPEGLIPKVAMEFISANFPEIIKECVRREYGVDVHVTTPDHQ